jgi:16S rRNA (uracil1498-N3)-methyltransferase
MDRRFFTDQPVSGDSIQLSGAEGNHIAKVLRASVGESVIVFDGSGFEFTAEITSIGRGTIDLTILERREVSREATRRLTLGVALPKGDRQRTLIEKCVELGVTALVPLKASRGVAVPKESALERARRGVIEASKQCGRNVLMAIAEPQTVAEFVNAADESAVRWLAHPPAAPPCPAESLAVTKRSAATRQEIFVAIGPEGGFDESEVQTALAADWQRVGFGNSILRIETAALAAAAYWLVNPV